MNLAFKDFGKALGGSDTAEKVCLQFESTANPVILDFPDVRTVSHSLAL